MTTTASEQEQLQPYHLFTLTDMIGKRANAQRTTVIVGTEASIRTVVIYLLSLGGSMLAALILGFAFLGAYAALIPMLLPVIITGLAVGRSRRGLELTHLRRTLDQIAAGRSRSMIVHCNRLYDPTEVRLVTVTSGTIDVEDIPGFVTDRDLDYGGIDLAPTGPTGGYTERAHRTASTVASARSTHASRARMHADAMDLQREIERQVHAREWEAETARLRDESLHGAP